MPSPALFRSISFRNLHLKNRIMVSPMCQYSSQDGCVSDWHKMHLGQFAIGGAGLLIIEMTNVEPRGRISPYCVGLYNDATESALKNVVEFCNRYGNVPIGIQLAHAGRKASTAPPWQNRSPISEADGGWRPVGPSSIPYANSALTPIELAATEIEELVEKFAQAAIRADRIGFKAIELHAAHGYLLHQFLSPLSNRREDQYGGSLENRMKFPLNVYKRVREVWPNEKPIGMRVSATDWVEGGWNLEETVAFAKELKTLRCDWIDVSSGGLVDNQKIETGPGYQVGFSRAVREQAKISTIAVGMITEAVHAEQIISNGDADMVALARGMLYNPRWVWHVAEKLGAKVDYPNQYLRCHPSVIK